MLTKDVKLDIAYGHHDTFNQNMHTLINRVLTEEGGRCISKHAYSYK